MSKWKCGICNSEFENYHAQGFDNIIYCPLCYYKKLYKRDKKEIDRLNNIINELEKFMYKDYREIDKFVSGERAISALNEINRINKKLKELKDSD